MYSNDPRNRPMVRAGTMAYPNLLGSVLGITAVGFIITAITAYYSQGLGYGFSLFASIAGLFLIYGINRTRENSSLSLLLFYAFTALEGVGIGPLIQHYTRLSGEAIVVNAAATTGVGMAIIGSIVYAMGFDFRRWASLLYTALIGLIVVALINVFINVVHPMTLSWVTLVIFTGLLFVRFSQIRAGGQWSAGSAYVMTPVQLAIGIYLDAINIFLALLRIFSGRNSD